MSEADPETPNRMNRQVQTATLPPVIVTSSRSSNHNSQAQRETGSSHRSSRRGHLHRSRSSSRRPRSRSRHSSRRESRRNCRVYCKQSTSNFSAAACSMVSIVLLSTALEPEWITISGGRCHEMFKAPGSMQALSTTQFFYNGHFYKNFASAEQGDTVYKYGSGPYNFLINCVTYPTVLLFKSCIAFTFVAVVSSFVAFLLELIGPKYQLLWVIRTNALLSILSVLLCMLINLFIYWITTLVDKLQRQHPLHEGSKVQVTFGVSFYLVACAGFMCVMATACSCLQRRSRPGQESCPRGCEHSYFDDTEALLSPLVAADSSAEQTHSAPPPAYTP
ncbi:transmembrane protein 127-like [Plakobranchus ocellatus]|uniref:Transmembrane protein 127-like n=1 Tax=Plakobranchus ocellatus TaxID=259542 RepID=A0AAV4AS47_9GAST|nr:transmembrane protein 127-like [Plakobranchus ocellatus]